MQITLDAIGENTRATSDIGHPRRPVVAQLRDHLVVRRAVHPLLQQRQVVGRGRHTPEPRDNVVETTTLWCLRHLVEV